MRNVFNQFVHFKVFFTPDCTASDPLLVSKIQKEKKAQCVVRFEPEMRSFWNFPSSKKSCFSQSIFNTTPKKQYIRFSRVPANVSVIRKPSTSSPEFFFWTTGASAEATTWVRKRTCPGVFRFFSKKCYLKFHWGSSWELFPSFSSNKWLY